MNGRRIAIRAQHDAVVEDFDVPDAFGVHEVLLEIHYSLISPGTELGAYNAAGRKKAIYPGYTAVGKVLGVGTAQEPALKDKIVYVFPAIDDCSHCHASHKAVKPGGLVLPIPEGLDPRAACFARIVNIALTPYRNTSPKTTGCALVFGLGLVGNMVGQVGRIRGFYTIGIDPNAARRQRAQQSGFDAVVDPNDGDPIEAVRNLTEGQGANLTVNATGRSAVFLPALRATARGGEVSTLGGAKDSAMADLKEVFSQIHARHLTIRGGWEMLLPMASAPASKVASTETNLRDAFRWLQNGAVRLDPIWTHTIPPDQFKQAYDALNHMHDDYLGVIVDWT